ncbi:MAG: DEAD/DEAH box helicase [Treponema sp.]|jgi:superfamily II DNA/RNA helicase|nr:DEAD/DEAH box helicase [Treponema sp.]
MDSFDELGINPAFTEKLKERSIIKPTVIQSLVIPRLLSEKNTVFRSATGTGKTFAYLLPVLQTLTADESGVNYNRGPSILICAPTLELCSQIKAEVDFLSSLPSVLLIGSVRMDRQIETIKKIKPVIAVGNPNRLLVLAKTGKLKFANLKFFVLDEADRLTAQECLDETKELLAVIEREIKKRESGSLCAAACSATVGEKTRDKLGPLFQLAEIVESGDHEILRERIEHWALFSEKRRKVQTLRSLLAALKTKRSRIKALVFSSRNDEAGLVLSRLQYHHISAIGLFGKINKKPITNTERKAALDSFREGKVDVLVSTDLAARGLDIPGITHVIALDVPSDGEAYIHRCGRTGRAGKRGVMITIGDETQMRLLASLEKKLKIRVQPKELYEGRVCVPPQE